MRIVWVIALLAVAPAALLLVAPAPVAQADGACTAIANTDTADAYNACLRKIDAHCTYTGGFYLELRHTCAYPDGSRDECVGHMGPFSGARITDLACSYFPPGADQAPPPAEPAPAGDPS